MWILTSGDNQVHLWRLVFYEEGHGLIHWLRIDRVVVIKDEHKMLGCIGNFVE